MNTLVIVLIAAVCLFGAYTLYGRWLANKWGIDPTAKTPAVVHEDGRDYVPTNGWTVFGKYKSQVFGLSFRGFSRFHLWRHSVLFISHLNKNRLNFLVFSPAKMAQSPNLPKIY